MPYLDLGDSALVDLAKKVPERQNPSSLHAYIASTRELLDGNDAISIPESHQGLLNIPTGNHEGSQRLNRRVKQLASWFAASDIRFSAKPAGPGESVQRGSSIQERFAREGEAMLGEGEGFHNYWQEVTEDVAALGIGVFQQHPKSEYYATVKETPSKMADGALLTDIIWRRRIDPATFSWIEGDSGRLDVVVIQGTRHLGELSLHFGVERTMELFGYFDFGPTLDPNDPDSWGTTATVDTSEVWTGDQGALVVTGGPRPRDAFRRVEGFVLQSWPNSLGHPPFYTIRSGPWPIQSPLDEMIALTPARNYWATILDIQGAGSVFRHWQLVDTNTTDPLPFPSDVPEKLQYDMSKPPPDMGPGKVWQPAPFEFHDVNPRYAQIKEDHESAGGSVARLMGQAINQNTPVGTADLIDDTARREFGIWLRAIEKAVKIAWRDYFHWHRERHKDAVFVFAKERDVENDASSFLNTSLTLRGSDIVTEHIEVTVDTRSRLSKIADYRLFSEMRANGDMDYRTGVEKGWVPDVDDADAEIAARFVAEAERISLEAELMALRQQVFQNISGQGGQPPDAQIPPNIVGGSRVDPRGTGTQQGPNNVSNTGLAAGGSDLARSA